MDYRETGGRDPLDARVGEQAETVRVRAFEFLPRVRVALGLQPLTAPAILFVPLGFVLGPRVLNLLPTSALAHLDVAVTVGLATVGVFVALAFEMHGAADRRMFAAATTESLVTAVVVGGATLFLMRQWGLPLDAATWVVAAVLGIAASASSAGAPGREADPQHAHVARIADLDDAWALVAASLAVAVVSGATLADAGRVFALTLVVGLLAGLIGWLLFERAASRAERGVFVLGALALVGGGAQYVGGSPLLAGLVAGACWKWFPGRADAIIRADVSRYQHPLVLLLLVVAGALTEFSATAIWLLGPFVVFRMAGKVLGASFAALLAPGVRAADLAAFLLPPGLLGIALSLNLLQASASPTAVAVVSTVAIGTLASELLAMAVLPDDARD
jgi:hypothetical protein